MAESLPDSYKAVRIHAYTGLENVKIDDLPLPNCKSNEVLIQVRNAAVNPVDWKMAKGNLELADGGVPKTLGFDVSGVVVALGSSVKRVAIGDAVWAMAHFRATGSFAEYFCIDEKLVSRKPDALSFAEAAAFPLAGLTSYQSLKWAQVKEGSKILVLGGSGGTGSLGIMIAKCMGASHIACTCSEGNFELVKSFGADEPIDYHNVNWWEQLAGQEYDVIYDTVGGVESWNHAGEILKPGGVFVTIAGDKQTKLTIGKLLYVAGASISRKFMSLFGKPKYNWLTCKANGEDLDFLRDNYMENITIQIDSHFPLAETQEALAKSRTFRARGKIVIDVSE